MQMLNIILFIIILWVLNFYIKKYKNKNNKKIEYLYKSNHDEENDNYSFFNVFNPNIWIDKIINNKPIYNKLNNHNFELPKYNYDINLSNDDNNIGKTIKQIYDESIIDYRKSIVDKDIINNDNINGASDLQMINPNMWTYENDKSLNGNQIDINLYAYDPVLNNSNSAF
jgi:hypothetical protein